MIGEADTLYVVIQVAVALAGFATIVVALRDDKWRDVLDLRLFNLIICAFGALGGSLFVIFCMHAGFVSETTYKAASVLFFVGFSAGSIANWRRLGRIMSTDKGSVSIVRLVIVNATNLACVSLQIANIAIWAAFWPVLLAVYVLLGLACLSFIQLIGDAK
ncbi:MAG: hypothetical protein ABL957_16155 [Parvularculaceae bacterium]